MAAIVDCPTCGKKVEWTEQSKYRPFCSNRCKQIDLGAWAEEKYSIPTAPTNDESSDDDSKLPDQR
ncbi:MAG TPA: DNA gyrase inhibitor YacG [Burkholderiaceae bacterium]|jgi:hypothetical protein